MKTPQNDSPEEKPMNNDYLWDGSGQPDPEIQRLESLLSEFRSTEQPLQLPAQMPVPSSKLRGTLLQFPWIPRFAAAAIVLFTLVIAAYFSLRPTNLPNLGPAWDVEALAGAPQIGSQIISGNNAAILHVGQTLVTNADSRASISENSLGEIKIDPNSRVRLLETPQRHKRLQLQVGTIHAAIWAPAGQFVVDTPSAVAIDLGCAYTLQVAPDGSGTLRTTLGWVGFELNGRDSFIPAGAMCSTRPNVGPGTPYFEDSSQSFQAALTALDFGSGAPETRNAALTTVLSEARAHDALSLWHLLSRTEGEERARVYSRFAALVPPPPGVTREGILRLDSHMLDPWWNSLGFGDIDLWRYWEQSSTPKASTSSQPMQKKESPRKKTP